MQQFLAFLSILDYVLGFIPPIRAGLRKLFERNLEVEFYSPLYDIRRRGESDDGPIRSVLINEYQQRIDAWFTVSLINHDPIRDELIIGGTLLLTKRHRFFGPKH
jgi:hypothetical protein